MKTRLLPLLSPEQAAALHSAFVLDTVDKAMRIKGVDVELHTDVTCAHWASPDLPHRLQSPGGLGARMLASLHVALGEGHPRALILGTDAPTLPAGHILELLGATTDVALGPTVDGGFYGIAAGRIDPAMFDGVPWSTPETLSRTVDAIRACSLSLALVSPWYDVDGPADLLRLEREPNLPRHTSGWLREYRTQPALSHPTK